MYLLCAADKADGGHAVTPFVIGVFGRLDDARVVLRLGGDLAGEVGGAAAGGQVVGARLNLTTCAR